jgi:hypothetical protein
MTPPADCACGFRFEVAGPSDEAALREFGRDADMPGAVRFSLDRSPDYFDALRVEGRKTEVLVCRETRTRRIVGTAHRSVKPLFVNGEPAPVGFLSGLRLDPSVRNGLLLARGYAALKERHADGAARFYLSTIMEDNRHARFCCMAISLQARGPAAPGNAITVRRAGAADGPAIVDFLRAEGRSRQFFPEYRAGDFGAAGELLPRLEWEDVFMAFREGGLTGVIAAWDQSSFRRWKVTGYAGWLRAFRRPFNLVAGLRRMPRLPEPGAPLACLFLSLVCIRDGDRAVFSVLMTALRNEMGARFPLLFAGLHERDPLLPELLATPHFPLPSRLYAIAWGDGEEAVGMLERTRVPYLELGSL